MKLEMYQTRDMSAAILWLDETWLSSEWKTVLTANVLVRYLG